MTQSLLFALVAIGAFGYAFLQFRKIYQKVNLGQETVIDGSTAERWRNVALVAFGQKKMFKRIIPAVLHLFIYVAFIFTQIELIEILIDGFFGVHRFFADKLGFFYTALINSIEILSLLALIATFNFLIRRNLLSIPRFKGLELQGWPHRDANLILYGEIVLVLAIFTMNGADVLLQEQLHSIYPDTGTLLISGWTAENIFSSFSTESLVVMERAGWWAHVLVVFAFLNYLPISKHLHIILAFPNTYYASLESRGKMENMPAIMNEVKSMMGLVEETPPEGDLPEFGAKDIFDLSWKNLLDAYTCTECGRCTSVCPANLTGKKLSPRKILMDIRDRTDEVAEQLGINGRGEVSTEGFDDGKSLFDYISKEEIHACTTCNACVEACPVLINPLEPILKLRRYEILTESAGPQDWVPMFTSLENTGSVWQVTDSRAAWTQNTES